MRRYLGYGPDDWDALGWHHQQMFLTELNEWLRHQQRRGGDDGRPEESPADADSALAQMGFTVT